MKVLLTGGSGQLGAELVKLRDYAAPSHAEFDLLDREQMAGYLAASKPDLILHAAAYTDTLHPETDPVAAHRCYQVNAIGTRNLVDIATCPIIFVSTESAYHPYNFYILTKLQAELEIRRHSHGYMILRTSFRCNPFEYPKAATDMYTVADSVERIAPLIDACVDKPITNELVVVGTGVKTVYELAKRTRPEVVGLPRLEISTRLPAMEELLDV